MLDRIDILLATYNGEQYIHEQIQSIIMQKYTNWTLLISDDCSSDDTLNILREYEKMDSRIHIVSHGIRYGSAQANFMNLLSATTAQYISFCDQDDVWDSDKLSKTIRAIKQHEALSMQPVLVYTDLCVVDQHMRTLSKSYYTYMNINPHRTAISQLLVQNVVTGCTMMINGLLRDLAIKSTLIDQSRIVMHDWWLALLASVYGELVYIDSPTVFYRQHGDNSVGATKYSVKNWVTKTSINKNSILKSIKQSNALLDCLKKDDDIPDRIYVSVYRYSNICKYIFFVRPIILIEGDYLKSNISRRIGQYFYIQLI